MGGEVEAMRQDIENTLGFVPGFLEELTYENRFAAGTEGAHFLPFFRISTESPPSNDVPSKSRPWNSR